MSNLIPLAPYQAQRDRVRDSLIFYPDRGPKPGPIVRPFPVAVEPPTYRPAA